MRHPLRDKRTNERAARRSSLRRRLRLRNVTVCAADSLHPELAARALDRCVEQCDFADAILFSHTAVDGDFRNVAIDRLKSISDYNRFSLRDLRRLTTTPHVLVIQWDGYVVDPDAWSSSFLKYDFIGAPIYPTNGEAWMGNGGFSLRSRKLLEAIEAIPLAPKVAEDATICRTFRQMLERDSGIAFAPLHVASQFSYEGRHPGQSTFGFHGPPNFYRHETDEEIIRMSHMLPAGWAASFAAFGLLINCLQQDRLALAGALYADVRSTVSPAALEARMAPSLPPGVAREVVRRLEETYRPPS